MNLCEKNEVKKSSNFFIFVQVKRHFNLRISLLKCPTWMRMGVQVSVDFAPPIDLKKLHAKIGEQALEIDFLEGVLKKLGRFNHKS